MRKILIVAIAALFVSPLIGQEADIEVVETPAAKLAQFQKSHPDARFHGSQYFDGEGFFEQQHTADYIYGTVLATGQSVVESGQNFCKEIEGIYAENVGDLVPGEVRGAIWNKNDSQHRFSVVRFQQAVNGIPVFRSGIGFLVRNQADFPVVMSANNFKEMNGFAGAAPRAAEPVVTEAMIANTNTFLDTSAVSIGAKPQRSVLDGAKKAAAPELKVTEQEHVIWAGVSNVRVEPQMAVSFMAERGTVSDFENYRRYFVIASIETGEILFTENQVSTLDVDGVVSGNATENGATFVCGPESGFGMPYAGISISGGASQFADANGNFSFDVTDGETFQLNASLRGEFFEVFDEAAGGTTPTVQLSVTGPDTANLLFNSPATDLSTANTNAYLHCNIVRDFVLSFEPNFPVIATQRFFDTNTNLASDCNAFYNGVSTNYFTAGGGCNNTSFGDVVYHEYGHHLVNVTGNGQGQFGEGSGDTIGMLIEDDPELGQGFSTCGSGIRSALNFRTFPCVDEFSPHDCGQLLSGSVWDLRNELATVDSANALDIATELFIGMLIVRGQMTPGNTEIGLEIPIIFVELDDDDGNINNGTPHYDQIADALNPHNLTVPELTPIVVSLPNGSPTEIDPAGGTAFEVNVADGSSTQVPASGVLFFDDGSGFQSVPMEVVDSETYSAVFPAISCGTTVQFYVAVDSEDGNVATFPLGAPVETLEAVSVGSLAPRFVDSFDTDLGWTVSGNATDGQWERGVPNNGLRGDPSEDAESEGGGFCFVTDNQNAASTNSDVDGGSTVLTSPVMDASGEEGSISLVSYFRWYSNDFGASPNDDIFVVEISNDGGATWTNLETVGPDGPGVSGGWIFASFQINEFVTPTDNMQVRFTASDLGAGSVIEAGVDGLAIETVECGDVNPPLVGDVNGDGVVDLFDIGPFVDILTSGGFQAEADINQDGQVDLFDVALFVDLLSGN